MAVKQGCNILQMLERMEKKSLEHYGAESNIEEAACLDWHPCPPVSCNDHSFLLDAYFSARVHR